MLPLNAHLAFDLLAWSIGAALAVFVRKRYGQQLSSSPPVKDDPGYYAALFLGFCLGASWLGGLNLQLAERPPLGHSVLGAILGGIITIELYKLWRGPKRPTGAAFAPSLALGIAIGRWGCFFTGLPDYTYGTPTAMPWGVDFGDGIARHPVQLYESFCMAALAVALLYGLEGRARWAGRYGFYVFCCVYGLQRFMWEFMKPYPQIMGPLNIFHIACICLCVYGMARIAITCRQKDDIVQQG